jgi:transposase
MMHTSSNEYVLAFDFSLDRLDVALADPAGNWIVPHRAYANHIPGFQALKQDLLPYLSGLDEARLTTAGESTALFWWHAFYQIATDPDFAPYNPSLALLRVVAWATPRHRNPLYVKNFRRAQPEEDKVDPKDARLIGRYYQTMGVKHYFTFDSRYLPLRQLTRAYFRLTHTLAAEKSFALSLIYLLVSEYRRVKPFSDPFGVTSVHILSEYPDIAAIAAIPLDTLTADLDLLSKGHLKDARESAHQLHQIAQNSYPLPDFLVPTVNTVLRMTLNHVRFLEHQQNRYRSLIETELERLPEARLALAESGLGSILVGGCLGEIQDPRRFTTGRKFDRKKKRWRKCKYRDGQAGVARLAGLWWPRNSSGRFEGDDRHLARERNPYLRYWLVQAAYSLKRNREDYGAFYQHKYDETAKHKHKRALILTARKAVRLIFALLYKGQMKRLEEEANT